MPTLYRAGWQESDDEDATLITQGLTITQLAPYTVGRGGRRGAGAAVARGADGENSVLASSRPYFCECGVLKVGLYFNRTHNTQ